MNKTAACSFVWKRLVRIVGKIVPDNDKEFFVLRKEMLTRGR